MLEEGDFSLDPSESQVQEIGPVRAFRLLFGFTGCGQHYRTLGLNHLSVSNL